MSTASIDTSGVFDSGIVNIPPDSNWHRVLTVATLRSQNEEQSRLRNRDIIPIDIAIGTGGAVNVRLTCTSKAGETHAPFIADFTQASRYLTSATVSAGTVNQPAAGSVADYKVFTEGSAEIGVEVQAVSGATTARAYGTMSFGGLADDAE